MEDEYEFDAIPNFTSELKSLKGKKKSKKDKKSSKKDD